MSVFQSVDLTVYAELILVYIIYHMYKHSSHNEWSARIFLIIAYVLFLVNMLEGVTWVLNGLPQPWGRPIILATNTLLLAFNSLPAVAWVSYADFKIFNDIEKLKRRLKWYFLPFYISIILLIFNFFTGIVFTVDARNVYHRSIGVYIIALMTYAMITLLYFGTRKYKKQIDGKIMQSIFLVMLMPVIAGIIQMVAYGVLLIWPAFILATLIAFVQIEKDSTFRDALTELATRASFERRIQYLRNKNIGFSLILYDMNGFKQINDHYGHPEGDQALIIMASILKHSVKNYDLVCRYGGDEFVILVESEDANSMVRVNERIQQALDEFNHKKLKPYPLSVSIGSVFVAAADERTIKEILQEADHRMYLDKEKYKQGSFPFHK